MSLWPRLAALALAMLAGLAAVLLWAGAAREEAIAARARALMLGDQQALWSAVAAREQDRLARALDLLTDDGGVAAARAAGDARALARAVTGALADVPMVTVHDAGGEVLTRGDAPQTVMLDPYTVADVAQGGSRAGLWATGPGTFAFVTARSIPVPDGPPLVVVAASDAMPALVGMASRLSATRVLVSDLRGRGAAGGGPVAGPLAIRAPAAMQDAAGLWLSTPLHGPDGGVVGRLATMRSLPPLAAPPAWLPLLALACLSGLFLLLSARLLHPLRHALAVLGGGAGRGPEERALQAAIETAARDARRLDEIALQARRRQQRQERLIRAEIGKLAQALDAEARDEMLRLLDAGGTAAPDELAMLATVLARLSGRITAQHRQLGELVEDLRAAAETRARLAGLEQELAIARDVQLAMVPRDFPAIAGHEVAGRMIPAKEVGGDFFDFFALDDDRFALMVGDVSGKGVPAALFMAISRTLLRATARHEPDPARCVARVNDLLAEENGQMLFVTLFFAIYDRPGGRLAYVNAGHNPPLLCRAGGQVVPLPLTGDMALAVVEGEPFTAAEIALAPGDLLLAYTDGVTEATDPQQTLFGEARLRAAVEAAQSGGPDALVAALVQVLEGFAAGSEQADDITLLALRRGG
ncbi:MAG: serine/threonine-protein phosphatase [Rubellimicrobium sp.]|nr:serine/threonine-protein phosphatase [Rubellimicrobium sp.]